MEDFLDTIEKKVDHHHEEHQNIDPLVDTQIEQSITIQQSSQIDSQAQVQIQEEIKVQVHNDNKIDQQAQDNIDVGKNKEEITSQTINQTQQVPPHKIQDAGLISNNIVQADQIKQQVHLQQAEVVKDITNQKRDAHLGSIMQEEQKQIDQKINPKIHQSPQKQQHVQQHRKEFYAVIDDDPYLKQFEHDINLRRLKYLSWKEQFAAEAGSFIDFTRSYKKYGLNINKNGDLEYREWAPAAKEVSIFGDFNGWNRESHKLTRDEFGHWHITLPKKADGTLPISHESRFKCCITKADGQKVDRVPAWTKFARQNPQSLLFDAVFWNPPSPYVIQNQRPKKPETLRIYEAHVGMSSIEGKVNTYREFADFVLPRIKDCGYNCIQLMAIQEHSYYASFGYHVTNFFSISSRSGTPDDVKYLIDKAHGCGIMVIMDCIHSHASSNVLDGISQFDGTDHLYSHSGARGKHTQWDSMLFDYSKYEVLRFLLSNITFYMEEYQFDGFRFDAVTSILYHHHGIGVGFSGDYKEYFGTHCDMDGIVYLMLANDLAHSIFPDAITVAEDVSGMPTLCRQVDEGGLGFDYRLSMFIPDMWIKMMKDQMDEEWSMGHIAHSLTNRRWKEKCVAYAESHDQAIVGDKTLAQWLFDSEIYTGMAINQQPTVRIDRGMALHKMIRLLTCGLGGEAYLNFMGNEFGHPEWIDFPREGNGFSYHYSRRQWNLSENQNLRYFQLKNFDRAMNELESQFNWMASGHQFLTLAHEGDKLIIFERGDLVFIFNFHPTNSYEHYRVGTNWASEHVILMDSDSWSFGGHNRLEPATRKLFFPIIREQWQNRRNFIQLYIPSRTAIILCAEENLAKRRIQINGRPKVLPALEEVKVQETISQNTQPLAQTQGLVDKIEMSATIAPKLVGSQEETIAQVGANVVAQDLSSKLDSATKLL